MYLSPICPLIIRFDIVRYKNQNKFYRDIIWKKRRNQSHYLPAVVEPNP
jgi:hypothetical protein